MKPIIKKIVAFAAIIPISVGIGLTVIDSNPNEVRATSTLSYSYNFLDGGSSSNSAYAGVNLATNVSYASDNPGGTSGTTAWEADYANLSMTTATRLGGKLVSVVQTDDTTAWANIKTKFAYADELEKIEVLGVVSFGTSGNWTNTYLQSSTNGTTWATVATSTTKSGTLTFDNLTIAANSYLRLGIALTASSSTNSGMAFTGLKVYKKDTVSKTLSSITVTTQPSNKSYYNGDSFDPTGMVITATYSDSSTADVTSSCTYTPSPLTTGTTSVLASYTEGGITKSASISGITVTTPAWSTAIYAITAKNTFTTNGTAPTGSSASLVETYATSKQMTNGNSQTVTFNNYTNIKISKITLSAHSNSSAGAGSLSYSLNGGSSFTDIITTSNFNTSGWYGAWSSSYVDVVKDVDITVSSSIILKVTASVNSLFVESYDIQWEEVESPDLSSIAVSGTPTKTTYYAGESFDPTGITVTATYSDSSTANVTSSCTYAPTPLTQGTTSVTVSYVEGGVTKTTAINGITVGAALAETVVKFGTGAEDNSWTESSQNTGSDYVGLASTSHYVSTSAATLFGVNQVLDSSISVQFKVGTYGSWPALPEMPTITVALLNSSDVVLASNTGSPTLTGSAESYAQGMTISVTKPANPAAIASIKISISAVGSMTSAIFMRLQELTLSFSTATVVGKTLSSIAVTTQPTDKSYYNGESFDPSGMVITATYSDSSTADVTSSCTYTPSPLTTGTTSVLATYVEGEETKTVSITGISVLDRTLNSISIKTSTSKVSFTLGEPFAYPGLVVNANWNSGTLELTNEFTVTGVDTLKLGVQTATISYLDKTATYSVNVTNQNANVGEVAVINELFISEYYEGASNDKYIEIYNGTSSAIDLATSGYRIKIDANGAGTWAATNIALTGTIPAYGTYILAHSSANASILALANQTNASVTHNGDDSVGLFKGETLIDLFGVLGTDPGTGWTIGEITNATVDHVIVRKSSVIAPVSTWNNAEWDVYANSLDYCGSHSVDSGDVTSLQQATAFANYVMTGIGLNAQGSCSSVLQTLLTEYNYMNEESILEFETAPEELFVNARARMAYLQAWVDANTPQGLSPAIQESSYSSTIILVASLGLGTVFAYFFFKKKKTI